MRDCETGFHPETVSSDTGTSIPGVPFGLFRGRERDSMTEEYAEDCETWSEIQEVARRTPVGGSVLISFDGAIGRIIVFQDNAFRIDWVD